MTPNKEYTPLKIASDLWYSNLTGSLFGLLGGLLGSFIAPTALRSASYFVKKTIQETDLESKVLDETIKNVGNAGKSSEDNTQLATMDIGSFSGAAITGALISTGTALYTIGRQFLENPSNPMPYVWLSTNLVSTLYEVGRKLYKDGYTKGKTATIVNPPQEAH